MLTLSQKTSRGSVYSQFIPDKPLGIIPIVHSLFVQPHPPPMSSTLLVHNVQPTSFFKPLSPPLLTPRRRRLKSSPQRSLFRASASGSPNGSDGLSWERVMDSILRGSGRFVTKFGEAVKKETGIDFEDAQKRIPGLSGWVQDAAKECEDGFNFFRFELVPEFLSWNKWENWKDIKSWEPKRIGALVFYTIAIIVSCRKICAAIQAPRAAREKKELMEAYMEALIPEPTPSNIRKLKKGMWRKTMPKGLKIKKFVEGSNRTMIYDSTYIGEDAWEDDIEHPLENAKGIIDGDPSLNADAKKAVKKEFGISATDQELKGSWRERLQAWSEVMEKEKLSEQLSALNARYAVEFDMKEVEESLRKDVAEKASAADGARALWISKRWWRYRPSLPYTYFLEKLDNSEVAAVVFTEDLKRLYVTMKEGFPLEYIVDIPLDPFLFESISNSGVEVDLLQKQQIHYFLKVVIALLPGILILWFMRESLMLLHIASSRFLYKKYKQFFDLAHTENFVLPVGEDVGIKSMSREVVLGGDIWDLLDEIMIYMRNPMQYYEREVQFVRGILLYGPPGTGKTLFARSLSNKGGLPFVFASGAEFTDSEKSGAAKINELFSIARRNAPSFVFIDEIDAIAGRHCRSDPRRRATFEALIAQLDGEKVKTGVDRCSLGQAVIFLCATNRRDELDLEFLRPGRIDRRVYVGLPNAKQREQIFGLHSAGMRLAEDVDFGKLVFRTVGYSGADIRNLVNEAGIMSVRKGHFKIFQQDIIDVLDKQLLEGMGVLLTEEEQQKCEKNVSLEKRRLLAVHEAGHVVLAHLFPRFDWHAFSQLLPGGKETAVSIFYPREEMLNKRYTTFGYMMMQMVVAHGGRCAERVVFGDEVTDGGKDDLEKITKIAREMVISPSNSRLGLAALIQRTPMDPRGGPDGELIRYEWDDPRVTPAEMTPEMSELFTRELTRYIEETEELAIKGLEQNRHILDEISKELLEKSRITGLEVQEQMKRLSPIMFEDFAKPFQIDFNQEGPLPHNDRLSYQPLDVYPAPLHRC